MLDTNGQAQKTSTRTRPPVFDSRVTCAQARFEWPEWSVGRSWNNPKSLALVLKVQGGYFRVPGSVVIWENLSRGQNVSERPHYTSGQYACQDFF
jgi:hypothetical protein